MQLMLLLLDINTLMKHVINEHNLILRAAAHYVLFFSFVPILSLSLLALCLPFFICMNASVLFIQNELLALHPFPVSCHNANRFDHLPAFLWYFSLFFFLFFFFFFCFIQYVMFFLAVAAVIPFLPFECSIHLISSLVFLLLFSLLPSLFWESHK